MKRPKPKDALEGRQWQLPLGAPREHAKRAEYRRCGNISCHACREGLGHGPYLYAVWREGKKVKRKYLGKARA
jgi:hypothetical protein